MDNKEIINVRLNSVGLLNGLSPLEEKKCQQWKHREVASSEIKKLENLHKFSRFALVYPSGTFGHEEAYEAEVDVKQEEDPAVQLVPVPAGKNRFVWNSATRLICLWAAANWGGVLCRRLSETKVGGRPEVLPSPSEEFINVVVYPTRPALKQRKSFFYSRRQASDEEKPRCKIGDY